MKKILAMLCMLTCVFGLTACGEEVAVSEIQQSKCETAKVIATDFIVPYMTRFFDDDVAAQHQSDYDVHELEALTENEFSYYIYYASQFYDISYDFSSIDVDGNAIMTGIASFNSAYDSLGELDRSNALTATCKVNDDQIIVTVPLTGTATDKNGKVRTAEAEIIFSNDIFLTIEGCALNLEQSKGELMVKAASDTVMGMGTVFIVLILISLIIWAFGGIPKLQEKLSNKNGKKEDMQTIKQDAVNNTIAQIIEKETVAELSDDLELVAVIAAAIAASEGAVSTDGFVVRSIRKRR